MAPRVTLKTTVVLLMSDQNLARETDVVCVNRPNVFSAPKLPVKASGFACHTLVHITGQLLSRTHAYMRMNIEVSGTTIGLPVD